MESHKKDKAFSTLKSRRIKKVSTKTKATKSVIKRDWKLEADADMYIIERENRD